jgi:signal peptidase I
MAGGTLPSWVAGSHPARTLRRIALLVVVCYVVFGHVLMPVRGVGISMRPTIEEGDLLFINRLAYAFRSPARGDIVAVRVAGRSVVYVKRLLGLPGDRVAFIDGTLHVNGVPLDEPYVVERAPWQLDEVVLGADEYFVVGDNRGMPMAQHEFGTTSRARLIGPTLF